MQDACFHGPAPIIRRSVRPSARSCSRRRCFDHQNQRRLIPPHSRRHFFDGSAHRRTGRKNAIIPAEILLTKLAVFRHNDQLPHRQERRVRKPGRLRRQNIVPHLQAHTLFLFDSLPTRNRTGKITIHGRIKIMQSACNHPSQYIPPRLRAQAFSSRANALLHGQISKYPIILS